MAEEKGPEFRRKIYRRGSSFETTIPMPLLFNLDLSRKNEAVFRMDREKGRWYVDFEEEEQNKKPAGKAKRKKRG